MVHLKLNENKPSTDKMVYRITTDSHHVNKMFPSM